MLAKETSNQINEFCSIFFFSSLQHFSFVNKQNHQTNKEEEEEEYFSRGFPLLLSIDWNRCREKERHIDQYFSFLFSELFLFRTHSSFFRLPNLHTYIPSFRYGEILLLLLVHSIVNISNSYC